MQTMKAESLLTDSRELIVAVLGKVAVFFPTSDKNVKALRGKDLNASLRASVYSESTPTTWDVNMSDDVSHTTSALTHRAVL